jgi:hypothetical protein
MSTALLMCSARGREGFDAAEDVADKYAEGGKSNGSCAQKLVKEMPWTRPYKEGKIVSFASYGGHNMCLHPVLQFFVIGHNLQNSFS